MKKLTGTVAHVMRRFTLDKWGGTETVVFNLSNELEEAGLHSPIFCTDMLSKPGSERIGRITLHRFRYVFPWLGLDENARAKLRLKGGSPLSIPLFFHLLFTKDLALIHTHVGRRLGGIARTVAKIRRVPYVVHVHGGCYTVPQAQYDAMIAPVRGKLEWGKAFGFLLGSRRVFEDADAIICVGQSEADAMRQRGLKTVHYLPNGVHVDHFSSADPAPFRQKYGLEKTPFALCLSRIDFQKNQRLLIEAFSNFKATHPTWKLVLIGPITVQDYHKKMVEDIQRLELQDAVVIIPGLRPDDPLLPSAYRAAELFVLPTSNEPFGIVILEAWAAQTPVIATRVGGIPGFTTDQKNILLFDDQNGDQLLEKMEQLSGDRALQNKLASNGYREVCSQYDWRAIAQRMLTIYRQVLHD